MSHISHKDLWNQEDLVDEYNISAPRLTWPEVFLIDKARAVIKEDINNILCVGCGGGREVLPLHHYFPTAVIYANDIAAKMIEKASSNFKEWGLENQTKTLLYPVQEIDAASTPAFNFISCFNNVLSFILPHKNREDAFKKMYQLTAHGGVIAGMVHQVWGTPQKTIWFLFRRMLSPFFKTTWNDRRAGRKNQKYFAHYYTRPGLLALLEDAGYKNAEILSLSEFYKMVNRKYNRRKGGNNLIFFAVKQ